MSQTLATAEESRDATMAAAPTLTRTLRFTRPMMRGDDVVWLQTRLQANGWGPSVAGSIRAVDGLFGPGTEGAVRNFQKAYGLQVDGIVGPITWSRLMLGPSLDAGSLDAAERAAETLKRVQASFLPQRHLQPDALAALGQWHSRFSGGGQWRLTAQGLEVRNDSVQASAGLDAKVAVVLREWFGNEIRAQARKSGVPVELIVATICAESAGSARDRASCAAAERREKGFRSEAATPHRISIGCMQTLISTACGTLGRTVSGAELRDPAVSIEAGTAYMAQQAGRTLLDPPVVACAYNAGSVRHEPSASNRWRMVQFPVGTSAHADRFVSFFNACLRLLQQEPGLAADAPSFAAVLGGGGGMAAPPPAGPAPAPRPFPPPSPPLAPAPFAVPAGGLVAGTASLATMLGNLVLREGDNDDAFRWGGIEQPGRAGRPIEALQRTLDAIGMLDSKVDGEFGPATKRALRRFQWYARHNRTRLRGAQGGRLPR
jgi:peptidoglycan hydrolase-like protein with peptidoglycan-binding domain